jgi:hypothetical protein
MPDSGFVTEYIGPNLPAAFDDWPVRDALNAMAKTGGDRLHAMIAELTPIRTGNLATSWYREITERKLHGTTMAYVSRVATDVDYAPYVNYGTGLFGPKHTKYLIEPHPPRQFLSWIDPLTGQRRFARRVWHPGSEGAHMVERAVGAIEGFLQEIMTPDLEAYKRAQEAKVLEAMGGIVIPK